MSKEHEGGLWIRPEIWSNQNLSATEKCLLAKIDNLDKSESGCYASNEHLGDFIGLSAGRVANMICDLKKRGFIDQYFFDGKNRKLRLNENKLHENVKDKAEKASRKREKLHENNKDTSKEASQIRERSFTKTCENLHENVSEASHIREHNKEYIRDNKEREEPAPEISNLEADKLATQFFCRAYLELNPDWKNSKYALPYFQNLQKKGEWFLLQLPKDAKAKYRWMGQHLSGIDQWAAREPKFYKTGNTNYAQVPPVNGAYRIPKPNYEPEQ